MNPWLDIPSGDYESHMNSVGQSQVLGELTRKSLQDYRPRVFAMIGCALGNGLEYVDKSITPCVYALDINPIYLAKTQNRFQTKIEHLHTICCDLMKSDISGIRNVDLAFCGLVLEYVDPLIVLPKIIGTLSKNGKLIVVTQKNRQTSFVTKTSYTSLEKLSGFASEVDSETINQVCDANGLRKIRAEEIPVGEDKTFEVMDFEK